MAKKVVQKPKKATAAPATTMTSAEAVLATLIGHGLETIYALPGVQNDDFFDALVNTGGLRPVHTRHEQATAYMALGAALASGKPQAYCVVPGPGFLNTTTPLATAQSLGAPVLAISGQIYEQHIGKGIGFLHEIRYMGFIDIVITGATLPSIQDNHDWGDSSDKRRDVTASLLERTKLTVEYNKALQIHARELGLRYLEVSSELIDQATKTVQPRFLSANPNDPQLDCSALGAIWAEKLRALVASNASRRRLPAA